jgi:hypothetical protein
MDEFLHSNLAPTVFGVFGRSRLNGVGSGSDSGFMGGVSVM